MTLSGARASRAAYVILAGLVVIFAAVATWHGEWVSDSWIHLGAVREMSEHLWSPREPLVGEEVAFPYFSPWTFVAAVAVRVLSISPEQAVAAYGVLSPLALVLAFHRLVRAISAAAWAPALALAAFVTVWGTQTFFWSGFLSLNTLVVGSAWPSVLATAIWFFLWAAVWASTRTTPGLVALLLVAPGVLLLVHPFTFISAGVACTLTVLVRWEARRWLPAGAVTLASVGLAAMWPWTSLADLLTNPAGFDTIHAAFYEHFFAWLGLLLLSLPALVYRLARDHRDPLSWSVVIGVGIWGVGGLVDVQSLARVLPLATTSATIAMGVVAAEVLERRRSDDASSSPQRATPWGHLIVGCWVVAVVTGMYTQASSWSRVTPNEVSRRDSADGSHIISPYPDVDTLWALIPEGSVVIAPQTAVARQLPANGLLTVAPQWPSPGVTDAAARIAAQATILDGDTDAGTRDQLLNEYDVGWVVWPAARKVPAWLAATGTRVGEAAHQDLYRLR